MSNSLNPYATPSDVAGGPKAGEPVGPAIKVHPAGSILIATFLGSFFAGCLVLAINLWKAGRGGPALILAATGFLAIAVLIVSLFNVSFDVPSLILLLLQMVAVYLVSLVVWEPVRRSIPPDRLEYASKWWGAGIGILGCLPVVGLVLGLIFWQQYSLGERVVIAGGNECYVSGDATGADAQFLGDYLMEEGFLSEGGSATVMISKQTTGYIVTFVFKKDFDDPTTILWLNHAGEELASRRFGKPLTVVLKDEALFERRRMTIE